MMLRMNWDDVRVFLSVERAGSLAGGARAAGLDKSTASRRIASLDASLGARLFLRARDGLRLSAAGVRFRAHAEEMATIATSLMSTAQDEASGVIGRVRVATTESLAAVLVREGLLELTARHPKLELELFGENRIVDLTRGEADLALRIAPAKEPSLQVKRVALLPFAVFASEDYVARRGRPESDAELGGHDVVAYAGELERLPEARWLLAHPEARIVLRTTSIPALLSAVVAGYGLAVIAGAWAGVELGLSRLFMVSDLPPRSLWLAAHPDALQRPAVRAVWNEIARIAKRGEGA